MEEENYDVIFAFEKTNWWYRAKRDLIYTILKKQNRLFNRTLDLGCGVGSNFSVLKKFSKNVIGIDNSEKAINYAKSKGYDHLHIGDATKTGFPANTFDMIVCSDVLEHIPDKKAIAEIYRILKPNGVFILTVPAHRYLWGPTDIISKHRTRYEKKEIISLMKGKFTIMKLSYWNLTMFFPNFIFLKLLSMTKKGNQEKNTLEFIPPVLNNFLYALLSIENRFFIKFNSPQGVSIVGVAQKNA